MRAQGVMEHCRDALPELPRRWRDEDTHLGTLKVSGCWLSVHTGTYTLWTLMELVV